MVKTKPDAPVDVSLTRFKANLRTPAINQNKAFKLEIKLITLEMNTKNRYLILNDNELLNPPIQLLS